MAGNSPNKACLVCSLPTEPITLPTVIDKIKRLLDILRTMLSRSNENETPHNKYLWIPFSGK
jgi:hypothetical protein